MKSKFLKVTPFLLFLMSNLALADVHVGTLVKIVGKVELYTNPSKSVTGSGPHALYNGEYYTIREAKPGDKVNQGNIVITAGRSMARVVYQNGDQFIAGPGTEYRVFWDEKSKKGSKSLISLTRGKIRGIVSKKGPRSGMEVKTQSAAMGIRGTDFYVASNGIAKTDVSVLRGKVEVKPKAIKRAQKIVQSKPIQVETGFSAEVDVETTKPLTITEEVLESEPDVQVKKTDKIELAKIQKNSNVTSEEEKKAPSHVAKKLEELEKKAVETTLDDIKEYNPDLYKELKKQPIKNVASINTQVVKKVFEKAPAKPGKPTAEDLEELGGSNVYDKYFKVD